MDSVVFCPVVWLGEPLMLPVCRSSSAQARNPVTLMLTCRASTTRFRIDGTASAAPIAMAMSALNSTTRTRTTKELPGTVDGDRCCGAPDLSGGHPSSPASPPGRWEPISPERLADAVTVGDHQAAAVTPGCASCGRL